MDALGLEQVHLVGHEWGAWTGFMACLRAPERFRHHLALNMTHPWPDRKALRKHAWRMWFTALWEYPLLGAAVLRYWPGFTRYIMRRGVVDPAVWSPADLDEYAESLRPVRRAHAGQALHWQYVLRDIPRLSTGRYRREHLTVPSTILFGADDFALSPQVLPGGQRYADDLRVQVLSGCGHYLAEERPDLVAEALRESLARIAGLQRREELTG
jgi:pimeloyl-ACP methyl ester carboxylesterase